MLSKEHSKKWRIGIGIVLILFLFTALWFNDEVAGYLMQFDSRVKSSELDNTRLSGIKLQYTSIPTFVILFIMCFGMVFRGVIPGIKHKNFLLLLVHLLLLGAFIFFIIVEFIYVFHEIPLRYDI